jgi:hypothetical protein
MFDSSSLKRLERLSLLSYLLIKVRHFIFKIMSKVIKKTVKKTEGGKVEGKKPEVKKAPAPGLKKTEVKGTGKPKASAPSSKVSTSSA